MQSAIKDVKLAVLLLLMKTVQNALKISKFTKGNV